MSQIGTFPQVGMKITKYLKPPPINSSRVSDDDVFNDPKNPFRGVMNGGSGVSMGGVKTIRVDVKTGKHNKP